jgi:hypothetical protein
MKIPAQKTPSAFCELVSEALLSRGMNNLHAAAARIHISPGAISSMRNKKFPGKSSNNSNHARQRHIAGKIQTLTRVCDYFGFDLDACLDACELPKDELEISRSRARLSAKHLASERDGSELILSKEELEMLAKVAETIGSLPFRLVQELTFNFRKSKSG